jgi:hypothetical protein
VRPIAAGATDRDEILGLSEGLGLGEGFTGQHPGGDTPGVAAAPVALAGAIVPGVVKFIVVLSAHADVFGVGITAIVGSMLVPPSCAMFC